MCQKTRLFLLCVIIFGCGPGAEVETDKVTASPPQGKGPYAESLYFSEGLTLLNQRGNLVFLDSYGKMAKGLDYGTIIHNIGDGISLLDHFHNGLALVMFKTRGGQLEWGYVNRKGENPFGKTYAYASEFEEGSAIVKSGDNWGVLDSTGQYLVKPDRFDGISRIEHGRFWGKTGERWQYYSYPDMKTVTPEKFSIYGKLYRGLQWVERSDGKGMRRAYMDRDGRLVTPWFENATDFSEGLAAFRQGGEWGYIDASGRMVLRTTYPYASRFSEGLAVVIQTGTGTEGGKRGFINQEGDLVIPAEFHFATGFKNGFAEVRDELGKRGFINREGEQVVEYQYVDNYNFHEGLAAVKQKKKWGFVDGTGRVAIPFRFDKVAAFNDDPFDGGFSKGIAKVEVEGYEFFIDKEGDCVAGCLE